MHELFEHLLVQGPALTEVALPSRAGEGPSDFDLVYSWWVHVDETCERS